MKKHLIAAAVATAVAAPAFAQNVTLTGTLGAAFTSVDTAGAVTDSVNNDNYKTSAVTIKGSEDLGGGMKAYFEATGDAEGKSSSFGFNRANYVGLSGSFGDVQVGRTSTETERTWGISASGAVFFLNGRGVGGKLGGTVRYAAPKIAGVELSASTTNNDDGNGATTQDSVTEIAAKYSIGKMAFGVVAAEEKVDTAQFIWATYDAGFAQLAVSNQKYELANVKSSYTQVGAVIPLAGGMQVRANYTKYSDDGSTTTDYKQMGVMLTKDLSKRTALFAGYKNQDKASTGSDVDTTTVGITHSF